MRRCGQQCWPRLAGTTLTPPLSIGRTRTSGTDLFTCVPQYPPHVARRFRAPAPGPTRYSTGGRLRHAPRGLSSYGVPATGPPYTQPRRRPFSTGGRRQTVHQTHVGRPSAAQAQTRYCVPATRQVRDTVTWATFPAFARGTFLGVLQFTVYLCCCYVPSVNGTFPDSGCCTSCSVLFPLSERVAFVSCYTRFQTGRQ